MFAELAKRKAQTKNEINDRIVQEMSLINLEGRHLLLDSVTFGTTNTFVNSGILTSNIHIPQIECAEFLEMAEKNKTNVNLYRCSASKLLKHMIRINQPFQSVYLDYCCSAKGNIDICPEEDLKLAMKLLYDGGVLAWTFTTRSTEKQVRKYQFIDEVRRHLDEFAKSAGYVIRHLFSYPYNSTQTHTSSVSVTKKKAEYASKFIRRFNKKEVISIYNDKKNGFTYNQLITKYNVSKGTLSYFFNDSQYVKKIVNPTKKRKGNKSGQTMIVTVVRIEKPFKKS